MSKFWQKKYTSKYTGAEIDAAVAKAGTIPAVTEADAGKGLVVNEEGKIVAGEAGGESYLVTITLTLAGERPTSWVAVADKTSADIISHFETGKPVSGVLRLVMNDQTVGFFSCTVAYKATEVILFIALDVGNSGMLTVYHLDLDTTDESISIEVFELDSQA